MTNKIAYLILEDGQVFTGKRFGATGDVVAELVFTTGMVGYLETLTDPSYHGQMVVQAFPLIGNYGVIPEDMESPSPRLCAYIVQDLCKHPSNFRSTGPLDEYLRIHGVIGLSDMDTRALTKTIRNGGVMNAAVCTTLPKDVNALASSLASMSLSANVYQVSSDEAYSVNASGAPHIVLWDFGFKGAMAKALIDRGCKITVMPAGASAEEILSHHPDGLLLSNGPGDPAINYDIIENLRQLTRRQMPIFGICLGHQLLALAMGAKTEKLKYGHRGANQPVRDIKSGKLYITSQNHGYAVCSGSLPQNAKLRFENLNDLTCEGIDYLDFPAFSVQFHPEACAGPLDTAFLFDRFLSVVGGEPHAT